MIKEYSVEGMHCAACSSAVERCVLKIDGVKTAEVSLLAKKLTIECDTAVKDETIINSVNAIGFEASLFAEKSREEERAREQKEKNARKRKGIRLCISALLLLFVMYFSMGYMAKLPLPAAFEGEGGSVWRAIAQLLLSAVIIALNYRYFTSGAKALFKGAPNMDTLVSLGSAASLLWSIYQTVRCIMFYSAGDFAAAEHTVHGLWYESAVMILVLVTFGKFIEEGAEKRASEALDSIAKLLPDSATLLIDGKEQTVSAAEIKEGDILLVKPGERIAADGVVVTGFSSVDESALTGESMPAEKGEGDSVFAASANIGGRITVRATRVGSATALSKISELVGKAAAGKAPIARLADKVSGIFTPVVMSISVITFVIWFVITKDVPQSLNAAISVLVISC
ncbi:MAG: cation-translocating P-type ATPase, partial [Clostridia bacterium]|nr:cation-translocating P-type ATPase [Clostridia bacterium]